VNGAVRTNPARLDTDDDGMPDGFEVYYRLLPLAAVDARSDADEDSVSNVNEYRTGSSPRAVDSNHDGVDDSDGDGLTPSRIAPAAPSGAEPPAGSHG
jgi:hypothetical protein